MIALAAFLRRGIAVLLLVAATPAAALDIQVLTSPGGAEYWLVEEPSIPIVSVEASFRGGGRLDPPGKEGLAYFFTALLEEGAGDLDTTAFSAARDELSARFGFGADMDSVTVSARMLAETVGPAMDLLSLALAAPRLDPEPMERVRDQILAVIAEDAEDPGQVAGDAWYAAAFPGHPYGRSKEGTADSIARLTRDDLAAARDGLLTRANARIAVVGAIGPGGAGAMVDKLLSGLPQGAPLVRARIDSAPPPGVTVIPLDVPQSSAVFGQAGLAMDDPDFMAALVMNHVLGSGDSTSRLMREVREKRGLAYGVYAYLSNPDEAAIYVGRVQTQNARMAETLEVVRAEWARMAAEGITADELEAAKRYLTGSFPLKFDSNAKIARYLVFLQEAGLGSGYLDRRNGLVEAVTLEDVKRVAARLLHPEALSIVVVGKPEGL